MIHTVVAVGAFAALFVVYGLLQRGRERGSCDNCACKGLICERTGKPRHIAIVESKDVRS